MTRTSKPGQSLMEFLEEGAREIKIDPTYKMRTVTYSEETKKFLEESEQRLLQVEGIHEWLKRTE